LLKATGDDFEMVRTQQSIYQETRDMYHDLAAFEQCYRALLDINGKIERAYREKFLTIKQFDVFMNGLRAYRVELLAARVPDQASDISHRAWDDIHTKLLRAEFGADKF
jgi:hypothetical protein